MQLWPAAVDRRERKLSRQVALVHLGVSVQGTMLGDCLDATLVGGG